MSVVVIRKELELYSDAIDSFKSLMSSKIKEEVVAHGSAEWLIVVIDHVLVEMHERGFPIAYLNKCRFDLISEINISGLEFNFFSVINDLISKKPENVKVGYIYAIQSEDGMVKIGRSIDPHKRVAYIKTQSGKNIINVYISPKTENYYSVEKSIHKMFSDKRVIGEWFSVKFDVVKSEIERIIGKTLIPASQLYLQ